MRCFPACWSAERANAPFRAPLARKTPFAFRAPRPHERSPINRPRAAQAAREPLHNARRARMNGALQTTRMRGAGGPRKLFAKGAFLIAFGGKMVYNKEALRESPNGMASASQADSRGFDSRLSLQNHRPRRWFFSAPTALCSAGAGSFLPSPPPAPAGRKTPLPFRQGGFGFVRMRRAAKGRAQEKVRPRRGWRGLCSASRRRWRSLRC